MKLKHRKRVVLLEQWTHRNLLTLRRMERQLIHTARELPPEFSSLHTALTSCQKNLEQLNREIEAVHQSETISSYRTLENRLTAPEIGQLLALNQQLRDITRHLNSVAKDVTPRLEAKLADPVDPMYDYEIEVRIDYVLREDDPDYAEDDDNILTSRDESLKGMGMPETCEEFALPEDLRAEPQCWLFRDLYEHDYGAEHAALSLKDCSRIGSIFVDVQVWQQYTFDVPGKRER